MLDVSDEARRAPAGDGGEPTGPVVPEPTSGVARDAMEVELRQLHGVNFVSFDEVDGRTLVELASAHTADHDQLRAEARRLIVRHVDGPFEVDILAPHEALDASNRPGRVQLLMVIDAGSEGKAEVHLVHEGRRAIVAAPAADQHRVASEVVRGLRRLGYPTPFVVEGVFDLDPALGAGSLVVMVHPVSGQQRRGLATGSSPSDATARAVLNGLNRYLEAGPTPP